MRIVCDNCTAKYNIDDATVREKVSGKGFKIRCKKCGHIVVVRSAAEGEAQPTVAEPAAGAQATAVQEPAPAPSQEAVWHLVINQDQVGPMTAQEVRERFQSRQVDGETYAWRDGLETWVKLSTIDEFHDLGAPPAADPGATIRVDQAVLSANSRGAQEPDPGLGLLGDPQQPVAAKEPSQGFVPSAGSVRTASPVAQTVMADAADVYGGASRAAEPAVAAEPAAAMGGVEVKSAAMTGARSENSVLFSLNNLQALATGGSPPGPAGGGAAAGPRPGYADSKTEGSGLIDIRAMAAQTLSANKFAPTGGGGNKPDDLPMVSEAPLFSPVAPSILLPTSEPAGIPKWVWGVVGVAGVLFLGMIGVLIKVLQTPTPDPSVTQPPQVAQNTPPSGAGTTAPPTATPEPTGTPPKKDPAVTPPPSTPDPDSTKKPKDRGDKPAVDKTHRDKPPKGAKEPGETKDVTPTPTPPPRVETPAPPKVKPTKPKDDLDALLDSATGGSGGGRPKAEAVKKDAPEQLSRDMISAGIKSINGAVQSCKDQFKSPGTYMIRLTIGRNGRVSDASAPGKSGDPTGDCLVKAVKGAKFQEFTGDPQTISYPFILR